MISDFTDRRPILSGTLITLLFTLVPASFFIITEILPGVELNTAKILIVYALVLQSVLSLKAERMIFVILPFLIMIFGVMLCETVYLFSMGMKSPGAGPDALAYIFSSVIASVFGPEMIGIAAGLIGCAVISAIREMFS